MAIGSFCMVRGLSKNDDHQGWPTTKNLRRHWLKLSKAVPKKRNLDQNVNDSKTSYLEFFS